MATEGVPAWVALGSNLGDPRAHVVRAVRWLDAVPGVRVVARSRLHRTAPVGPPQPDYVNAVVRVVTTLPPLALLRALQALEAAAGRQRRVRWGARTLDLDLIAWGERTLAHPDLTLPHPRMHERAFVLAPLCDIDPDWRHPRLGRRADGLLATLSDAGEETTPA